MLQMRRVRPGRRRACRPAGPSVREVCLLGGRAVPSCAAGDRLEWGGRLYQVEALHEADGATRYLHLAEPAGGEPGG